MKNNMDKRTKNTYLEPMTLIIQVTYSDRKSPSCWTHMTFTSEWNAVQPDSFPERPLSQLAYKVKTEPDSVIVPVYENVSRREDVCYFVCVCCNSSGWNSTSADSCSLADKGWASTFLPLHSKPTLWICWAKQQLSQKSSLWILTYD